MVNDFFRKADFILMAVIICAGMLLSYVMAAGDAEGDNVTIKLNGKIYGVYPLSEDREINVKSGDELLNRVVIDDGAARMESASCKNQICVNHASISRPGETIVCLPNKVILIVDGDGEGEKIDAISK